MSKARPERNNQFALRLKELRETTELIDGQSYSQQAFAGDFGVAQSTVGGWESGKREPDLDTLIRIANHFSVSTDSLLGRCPLPSVEAVWNADKLVALCRGKSVSAVSEAVGITSDHFQKILSGQIPPTADELVRLAEYFQCSVDYLLGLVWTINSCPQDTANEPSNLFANSIISAFNAIPIEKRKNAADTILGMIQLISNQPSEASNLPTVVKKPAV